jgi:hypothetical protein
MSVFVSSVFVHIYLLLRGSCGGEAARFVSSLFSFLGDWTAVAVIPAGVMASFVWLDSVFGQRSMV